MKSYLDKINKANRPLASDCLIEQGSNSVAVIFVNKFSGSATQFHSIQ